MWADASRLRRLAQGEQYQVGYSRPGNERKKALDTAVFQPGVYFRYNIRTNTLYKQALKQYPSTLEDPAVYYENPVLAFYADCHVPIPESYFEGGSNNRRVVEKRLNPVKENVGTYYMKFMEFLKEAIAEQKARKIYLPFSGGLAHQFDIPQICYLNTETRQCGKLQQGRWWNLDHRKVAALAILGNESSLYDDACQDSTEYTTVIEFLDLARCSPEVVIVCIIRRGWGEGETTPALLIDPGAEEGEDEIEDLSATATDEYFLL